MRKKYHDKLSPLMKKNLDEYSPIVKKYYDAFDPIGVFPSAPDDHYELEIDHIALYIGLCKNFTDVSKLIYITTCFYFGLYEVRQTDCLIPAKNMFDELRIGK